MGEEHEDIKYLKSDDIGAVISKGLAATYENKPKNPVEYFAKWLLNHRKTVKEAQAILEKEKEIQELTKKHEENLNAKQMKENEKIEAKEKTEAENKAFWDKLQTSEDLNDNLTELCEYLHRNIGATGVYIGKLEPKMKAIQDDDDENAHVDEDAPRVIKFKHANKDHQVLMVGSVLHPDQGISHQLFNPTEGGDDEAAEEEGEEKPETDAKDILKTNPHKYVSHVVRQKDIHFWTVPRLGSFMAIPLTYQSCMSDESLDAAIADWAEVSKRIEAQDAKKVEWEEEQAQVKEQKISAGDAYEEPETDWEDIQAAAYNTEE